MMNVGHVRGTGGNEFQFLAHARPAEVGNNGKRSTADAQFFLRRLGRRNLTKKGSKIFRRTYLLLFTQKRVKKIHRLGGSGERGAPRPSVRCALTS